MLATLSATLECPELGAPGSFPPSGSVRGQEVRVELLVYLHHLLAGEAPAGGEFRDSFEVVILSTRQAPVEHARRRVANVPEAVDHVARDEDDGPAR